MSYEYSLALTKYSRRRILHALGTITCSTVPPIISSAPRVDQEIERGDWPMYAHDAQNTGVAPRTYGPRTVKKISKIRQGATETQPALVDDLLYLGEGSSFMQVWDRDKMGAGPELEIDIDVGTIESTPAVFGEAVYLGVNDTGNENSYIVAYSQKDGTEQWRTKIDYGIGNASPTIADGQIYVANTEGTLYAINADTGSILWTFSINGGIPTTPAIKDDIVCIAGDHGKVIALTSERGNKKWDLELKDSFTQIRSSPSIRGNQLYVGSDQGLFALNLKTGEIIWKYEEIDAFFSSPAVTNNSIFIGGESELLAISASSGETIWRVTVENVPYVGSPVVADGIIYVGGGSSEEMELIGRGGNAQVFKLKPEDSDPVAVKVPLWTGNETLDMTVKEKFIKEAKRWYAVSDNDHVVTLHDIGSKPYPWIQMEYMDAGTLTEVVDSIDITEVICLLSTLCETVHQVHKTSGIVHADLKPSNILFRTTAEGEKRMKIADWGTAKVLLKHSTSIEEYTPQYAAPEQVNPDEFGQIDVNTDIYQLGVIAYQLFTGRTPFDYDGTPAILRAIEQEEPPPPSSVTSGLNNNINNPVLTALEKEKENRHESILYFRDQLQKAAGVE